MTFAEFDKFQNELIEEVVNMKTSKGREYANSATDRFSNFNRLASDLGLKNFQIGWVYTKKHLDAIATYCRTQETHSTESIRGRFVDAICYLTLMAGMVEEREMAAKQPGPNSQSADAKSADIRNPLLAHNTVLSTQNYHAQGYPGQQGGPIEQPEGRHSRQGLWCCLRAQSSAGLAHSEGCYYSETKMP